MEDGGGHVVPLAAIRGESLYGRKEVAEQIQRRVSAMAAANVLQARKAEFLIATIPGVHQAIGAEDHGVARLKLEREFVIRDAGEKSRWDAGNLQNAAVLPSKEQGARHSRAGNDHFAGRWIEKRVLNRGVPPRDAPEVKSFIEERKHIARALARFVDSAESANSQGGVESGGEALAGNVAEVQTDGTVRESEIVEVVSTDFRNRLKFMRDDDAVLMQGLGGEHGALDDAGFLKFLLA